MPSMIDLLRDRNSQTLDNQKSMVDLLKDNRQNQQSMVDLLRERGAKAVATSAPTTEAPSVIDSTKAKEFYSALPWITPYLGTKGMGPKPEGGFSELGIPLDVEGKPYVEPQQATGVIAETLKGLSTLATHPMETIKGGLDFVLSVPGFLFGLTGAASRGGKEAVDQIVLGGTFNLDEIYNAASKGMAEGAHFFEPGKELLIGEPTPESMLATQVIMAPITTLSILGQSVASYEGFRDYPNIRGAAKFAGDISGLVAMGLIIHGGSRKAKFTTAVERIVKKADEVARSEQAIEGIPSGIIKEAQRKVLDIEKAQLELEAKKVAEELAKEALIKEETAKKAEAIEEAKVEKVTPPEIPKFKDTGEAVEFGLKATPEQKVELAKLRDDSITKSGELMKAEPKDLNLVMEEATRGQFYREALEAKDITEQTKDIKDRLEIKQTEPTEPTKIIDIKTKKAATKAKILLDRADSIPLSAPTAKQFAYLEAYAERLKSDGTSLREHFREGDQMTLSEVSAVGIEWAKDKTVTKALEYKMMRFAKEHDIILGKGEGPIQVLHGADYIASSSDIAKSYREKFKVVKLKTEPTKPVSEIDWFGEGEKAPREKITDLDLQTGTREPIALSTENSPFRETSEHTQRMKIAYEERGKSVMENPEMFTGKLLNDMNRWLNGEEVSVDAIRNGLSELAARADELRGEFNSGQDFLQWRDVVREGASWARKADRSKIKPTGEGVELYSGVPLTKAAKELVAGAKKLSEYTKRARGLKAFKPKQAAKMLKEEFNRAFIDRSGNIRRELLDKLGDDGYRIVQKMYLSKGASALSANMLKQMRREVYSGLSKTEKGILDNLILADRMIDIGKYKTPKEFKYPEGLSPTDSAAYNELFQYIEKLSPRRAAEIKTRAKAYFDWMKKPLKDMLDAELITETEYNDLVSHNYRRIKLVDIYDKRYQAKVGKKRRTIYDSGVEALARGRDTDVFEPSSEIMALEVFNRSYGRILNNKANQTLLELARKDKENPFVRVKEEKGDTIPTGWSRNFVYEKGERKSIYLSPEMSKEWITNNPEMSYRLSQLLRYSSGSPVLRTFATGINWGFALANLPRDIMHTWFTARVFEGGEWKPIYNPNAPIFAMQIGRDLATTFTDAALRKGRYEKYIEEGGGMEFLVHQGRLFQRGRHVEGSTDAVYDFMGYFGETSEIMTRLAIRERVIRRRAKQQGISFEQARKDKKITEEATFAARDYMDFGQGGGVAKALDNAFPYLNAGIQGTRGLFRAFKDNPVSSTYKLSQFAALTSGLYIAMYKMHPKSAESLKGNIDMQNNICIPLGDDFGFEDEQGQMRYPYLKMPLDPGQKFFKTFFEASADKWLGNEVDIDRVVDSLKEQSPVGVTELPPTISATLGYVTNKDFWLNEDIWRQTEKPFGWPESKEEFIPGQTPQVYIDLGAKTGLSPERTKYAVEELVTSGTVWSYLLGQGYEAAFGDLPKSKKEQHLAMSLSKTPVVRRFYGITNPYSQYAQPIDKAKEKSDIDRWIQNRELDVRVDGYLFNKTVERKEVIDYIKGFKDKKIYDRLEERFKFQEVIKELPNRSFWLRLRSLPTEARAKVYVDRLNKADEEERKQLRKELGKIIEAGGVVSKGFREEVTKLHSPQ